MEEYEEFTRRFFYENRDIKGGKSMVILDRVKVGFAVPSLKHLHGIKERLDGS